MPTLPSDPTDWLNRFQASLYMNPDTGFLGTEFFMSWRGVTLLQYWRSYDELEKYARGGLHLQVTTYVWPTGD
uniref:monooxygenase family protein n=1 Tax=Paenibacillus sp. FSL W7-1088 TaxID=2921695 RepID=UPI00403FAB38